jgi:hypothetical protein
MHLMGDDRLVVQEILCQLVTVIRTPLEGGSSFTTVATLVHALQSNFLLSPLARLFRQSRSFSSA